MRGGSPHVARTKDFDRVPADADPEPASEAFRQDGIITILHHLHVTSGRFRQHIPFFGNQTQSFRLRVDVANPTEHLPTYLVAIGKVEFQQNVEFSLLIDR